MLAIFSFTKPGGLTSTEAAAKRIPLVHTAPIPGCENKNAEFFVSHGLSITGEDAKELARRAYALCEDDAALARMQAARNGKSTALPQMPSAILF